MARPKKPVDAETVRKLAERQWTTEMIAAFCNVSRDTIERRFAATLVKGRENGKAKLIDKLWVHIENNSEKMLQYGLDRFLGKPKDEMEHSGEIKVTVTDYRTKK